MTITNGEYDAAARSLNSNTNFPGNNSWKLEDAKIPDLPDSFYYISDFISDEEERRILEQVGHFLFFLIAVFLFSTIYGTLAVKFLSNISFTLISPSPPFFWWILSERV